MARKESTTQVREAIPTIIGAGIIILGTAISADSLVDVESCEGSFGNEHEKEVMLSRNFKRINEDITQMIACLLGKGGG